MLVSERTGAGQWNWQWTATFAVMIGFGVSGILWTRDRQLVAPAIAVAATLLGMYVVYKG